jgi:hypothetical protein
MRGILTLIVRCWIDDETPERLCGTLQRAEESEKHPFQDAESLLRLIQSLQSASRLHVPSQSNPDHPTDPNTEAPQ